MRTLLTGAVILILLLYLDWKFIRRIFNRASSAGEMNPEERLKRIIVDVVTKKIYIPEVEAFVRSGEFRELLGSYDGREADEELAYLIDKAYRSFRKRIEER